MLKLKLTCDIAFKDKSVEKNITLKIEDVVLNVLP